MADRPLLFPRRDPGEARIVIEVTPEQARAVELLKAMKPEMAKASIALLEYAAKPHSA